MARIRTVKPEFWEDEVVGLLPRDARLLFIATFNMADDEGLLRWTPAYIKANTFMYDDDLTIADVTKLMQCLTDAGLLFPYVGGVARQQMAVVVNFRKHQKVNRPQPGKLPPPSLQNGEVRRMYGRRDNWTCHLCGGQIPEQPAQNDSYNLSIDHVKPQSQGGTDHPSNVRAAHQGCNKGRGDRSTDGFTTPRSMDGLSDSLNDSVNDAHQASNAERGQSPSVQAEAHTDGEINSLNDSVNRSVTDSLPEGNGREGNGREGSREGEAAGVSAPPAGLKAAPSSPQQPDGRPSLHELPDDFELTDGMRKWAQQTYPRVDVDHETQKFIWHWQAEGTRRHNWYAAWQKWITGANQYLLKHGSEPSNVVRLHGRPGGSRSAEPTAEKFQGKTIKDVL